MKSTIIINCLLLLVVLVGYLSYSNSNNQEGFLENKKGSAYKNRHSNFDKTHRQYAKDGKHSQNKHIETGQYENSYQEASFQFLSSIFNKMEEVHHTFEIERHGKDPFLQSESQLYNNINPKKNMSGVEHYKNKSQVSINQGKQVLFGSEAITVNNQCIDVNYFTKNVFKSSCSTSCDCSGTLFCAEGYCIGNSGQGENETFQSVQQAYQISMLENYFLNLVQRDELHKVVRDYFDNNYQKGDQFDYLSQRETAETIYHAMFIIQQIVVNPKLYTGDANTYKSYNENAFQWMGKLVKDSLEENLAKFDDYQLIFSALEQVDQRVQNVLSQIQDPSNLQEWVSHMNGKIDIPDIDFTFPEITQQYNDFTNQQTIMADNYGNYQSFNQVMNTLNNGINFNAGSLNMEGQAQMYEVAKNTVRFMFASQLNIFVQ